MRVDRGLRLVGRWRRGTAIAFVAEEGLKALSGVEISWWFSWRSYDSKFVLGGKGGERRGTNDHRGCHRIFLGGTWVAFGEVLEVLGVVFLSRFLFVLVEVEAWKVVFLSSWPRLAVVE